LAVEQNISASSQNQAFNALLFFSGISLKKNSEKWTVNRHAGKEFTWQWFFLAKELTYVPETNEYRRYHLHETHVQKKPDRSIIEGSGHSSALSVGLLQREAGFKKTILQILYLLYEERRKSNQGKSLVFIKSSF